jgi:hypothetical protein
MSLKRKRNENTSLSATGLTIWVEQEIDPTNETWGRLLFSIHTARDLRKTILFLRVDSPQYFDKVVSVLHRRTLIHPPKKMLEIWLIPPLAALVIGYAQEWEYRTGGDFIYQSKMDPYYCKMSISRSENYKRPSVEIPTSSIIILPPKYVPLR